MTLSDWGQRFRTQLRPYQIIIAILGIIIFWAELEDMISMTTGTILITGLVILLAILAWKQQESDRSDG